MSNVTAAAATAFKIRFIFIIFNGVCVCTGACEAGEGWGEV